MTGSHGFKEEVHTLVKVTKQAVQKETANYVGMNRLYLKTADHRIFISPYGPGYDDAVGKVYQLVPAAREDAEANTAYVKSITPQNIFDEEIGEHVPIKVFAQLEHEDELVLFARIEYGRYERLADLEKRNGTWLILILYLESARQYPVSVYLPSPPSTS